MLCLPLFGNRPDWGGRDIEPELVLDLVSLEQSSSRVLLRAGVHDPPDESEASLGIAVVGAVDSDRLRYGLAALTLEVYHRDGALYIDLEELVPNLKAEFTAPQYQEVLLLPDAVLPALEDPELIEVEGEVVPVSPIEAERGVGLDLEVLKAPAVVLVPSLEVESRQLTEPPAAAVVVASVE